MRGRNARRSRRAALWSTLTLLALTLAACAANAPQDTLQPAGPIARQEDNLFRPVFWIAAAIFFLVEAGLVYVMIRFRRRSDADAPKQIHGNTRLEIIWTILPAALLAAIAVPTVITLFDVDAKPVGTNVVNVKITGHQWWWRYEYTDLKTPDGTTLKTANELVIPADRWVYLEMTSDDVIHSYWVPKLGGKRDVIPGRTTFLKIRADSPGVYRGQCAEFCAVSHANMRLRVIAQAPDAFDRWVEEQLRPAAPPADPVALGIFTGTCSQCHTIRGILGSGGNEAVQGITGPDLTHFASRTSFAGSMFDLVPEALGRQNLTAWMDDPPAVKPGALMRDYDLTPAQIDSVVAYLMSLK